MTEKQILDLIHDGCDKPLDEMELFGIWGWANEPYSNRENCKLKDDEIKIRLKIMRLLNELYKLKRFLR